MKIIYCVNDRPLYMFMAIHSINSLRKYNSSIPIEIIFIQQNLPQIKEIGLGIEINSFFEECKKLDVLITRKPHKKEGDFFLINKTYIADYDSPILFIDVDTFIHGDVSNLFDYDADFVACENKWVYGRNWNGLIEKPFNSGIFLFKNIPFSGEEWADTCFSLKDGDSNISCWLKNESAMHNREEMALSLLVSDLKTSYFKREHAHNVLWAEDFEKGKDSIIFHTYTSNWRNYYLKTKKRKLPNKLFTHRF